MEQQTIEITCKTAGDSHSLAGIFRQFKQQQINLRRIEMLESLTEEGMLYLYLQADLFTAGESPQLEAFIEEIRQQLQAPR